MYDPNFIIPYSAKETTPAFLRAPVRLGYALEPVVDAKGRVILQELLARPHDSAGHRIHVGNFVKGIEQQGVGAILKLDSKMLEIATNLLAQDRQLRLSVNVSGRTVGRPDWHAIVKKVLQENPGSAQRLAFEITETRKVGSMAGAAAFSRIVRDAGGTVVIDDGGAGYHKNIGRYSQLAKDGALGAVKLDMAQVWDFVERKPSRVEYLINTAHRWGVNVIAEGIETTAQKRVMREAGASLFQGHLHPHGAHTGGRQRAPRAAADMSAVFAYV